MIPGLSDHDSFTQGTESIDALRRLIASVRTKYRQHYPGLQIGLTGLPVMEYDEMQVSQRSMMQASVLSLLGVACLFVAGFGGVRHPLMTVQVVTAIYWQALRLWWKGVRFVPHPLRGADTGTEPQESVTPISVDPQGLNPADISPL